MLDLAGVRDSVLIILKSEPVAQSLKKAFEPNGCRGTAVTSESAALTEANMNVPSWIILNRQSSAVASMNQKCKYTSTSARPQGTDNDKDRGGLSPSDVEPPGFPFLRASHDRFGAQRGRLYDRHLSLSCLRSRGRPLMLVTFRSEPPPAHLGCLLGHGQPGPAVCL